MSRREIRRKRIHRLARIILLPFAPIAFSLTLASSIEADSTMSLPYCPVTRSQDGREIVKGQDLLDALKHDGDDIDCSNKTIEGDLDLYRIPAWPDAGKQTILIRRGLTLRYADVQSAISSWDQMTTTLDQQPHVKFVKRADFVGARFYRAVGLDGATFVEEASFGDTHFQKMASFTDATFEKEVSFRSATLDERALFTRTKFKAGADFALAVFNRLAFFSQSKFQQPGSDGANFLFARFNGDTLFSNAVFHSIARFVGTTFRGPTHFSGTTFENEVWFAGGAQFDDIVTFKGAGFSREGYVWLENEPPRAPVLFSGVVFAGDATFSNARFHHVAFTESAAPADIGRDTVFRKRANFRLTTFDTLGLERVVFQGNFDFAGAVVNDSINITDTDIQHASLRLSWNQLFDLQKPKLAWHGVFEGRMLVSTAEERGRFYDFLSALEKRFREQDQLSDAAQVRYFAEDLNMQESEPIPRTINRVFLGGIYGYGVSPLNQVWVALIVVSLFAFFYAKPGALTYGPPAERKLRLKIIDFPIEWDDEKRYDGLADLPRGRLKSFAQRYRSGLGFSITVFSRFGYGGVYAVKKLRFIVIVEWFLGLVVWVLFLINLSNVFPLLNRLVSKAG
jgi:uncharacterized protein YjbI with pentapeptide repeats